MERGGGRTRGGGGGGGRPEKKKSTRERGKTGRQHAAPATLHKDRAEKSHRSPHAQTSAHVNTSKHANTHTRERNSCERESKARRVGGKAGEIAGRDKSCGHPLTRNSRQLNGTTQPLSRVRAQSCVCAVHHADPPEEVHRAGCVCAAGGWEAGGLQVAQQPQQQQDENGEARGRGMRWRCARVCVCVCV